MSASEDDFPGSPPPPPRPAAGASNWLAAAGAARAAAAAARAAADGASPGRARKQPATAAPTLKPVDGREGVTPLPDGAVIHFVRRPFPPAEAASLFAALQTEPDWQQQSVLLFGAPVPEPRLVAYQASDSSLRYSYSGKLMDPQPLSPAVAAVLQRLQAVFPGAPSFNSVLLNRYRSGQDSMGWHTDEDVPRYGPDPQIASVSFGAERDFVVRRRGAPDQKWCWALGGGAALLMAGACQRLYQHGVPKRAGVGERINLTFRRVIARV